MKRHPSITPIFLAALLLLTAAAVGDPAESNPMAAISLQIRRIAAEVESKILRIEVDTPVPADAPGGVLVMTRRRVGTGFVVASGGFVLTTAETVQLRAHWVKTGVSGGFHRVRSVADKAVAIDHTGRRRTARVVGTCFRSNLALLQVDGLDVAAVKLAAKNELATGSLVVVFSAPGIPGNRMTLGLIGRTHLRTGTRKVEDLISLSVPAGGAGGSPIFSAEGNVVGMISGVHSTWLSPRRRASGGNLLGPRRDTRTVVAIPAMFLKRAIPDLKTTGTVLYGYLGVRIAPGKGSVTVASVEDDSPASRASLRVADKLVSLDGKPIGRVHDLLRRVAYRRPGEQITLGVRRKSGLISVKIVLGRRPETDGGATAPPTTAVDRYERMRQRLLRLPPAQRTALKNKWRAHLLNIRRLLEKQMEQLDQQIEALEVKPPSKNKGGSHQ